MPSLILPQPSPLPLGATYRHNGSETLFAFYGGRNVEGMTLSLFGATEQSSPSREIPISESIESPCGTGGRIWYTSLEVPEEQLYGVRVKGPYDPRNGERYNPHKIIVDPYAFALGRRMRWHSALFGYDSSTRDDLVMSTVDNAPFAPLAAVVDTHSFDWGEDRRPNIAWEDTVIYELHIKGATALHPRIPRHLRGTYLGLASKEFREHLKSLGVTTIELMPIHTSVPSDSTRASFWRYDSLLNFTPEPDYSSCQYPASRLHELKLAIKTLHRDGFEVIMDVVFNHTSEGNQLGPTLSLKGFANGDYYFLCGDEASGKYRHYFDHTGCGNSLNLSSPVALRLVIDSLRYWVEHFHVDGFRFDLATVLTLRDGQHSHECTFLEAVKSDPVLSKVKLIAEPWDTQRHHLSGFPAPWREWNDRYRDDVRRFWRGDSGFLPAVGSRLLSSEDIFPRGSRGSSVSVNFVTSHDGFTLNDLVSYKEKHNEQNGEDNRDGAPENFSANYGHEGLTHDPAILFTRRRQMRNLMATLLLSRGVPMLRAGDELSHSQDGNNNPYCLDNHLVWQDWTNFPPEFLGFVRQTSKLRKRFSALRAPSALRGIEDRLLWFRQDGQEMSDSDWKDSERRSLGLRLESNESLPRNGSRRCTLWILFNSHWEQSERFSLPIDEERHHRFRILLDTTVENPKRMERELKHPGEVDSPYRSIILIQSAS